MGVSILNIDQKQAASRHRHTCRTAVARLYHLPKLLQRHFALAHLEKSAYDGSHHISKETIRLNLESEASGRLFKPTSDGYVTDISLNLCAELAETCEVIDRLKQFGGLVHGLEV